MKKMFFKQNKKKNNKANIRLSLISGFTLVELLVVLSIVSFLSSIVLAGLSGARMKANDARIAQDMKQVRNAVELYYADNKTYPYSYTAFDDLNKENLAKASETNSNNWLDMFSFSTKKAEAVTNTLCTNFTNLATTLKTKGYLSAIPVHPYNNTSTGVCYKAKGVANSYLTVYSTLNAKLSDSSNKRTGFIVTNSGTVDSTILSTIYSDTVAADGASRGYPYSIVSSGAPTSVSATSDEVQGITTGGSVTYGGGNSSITEPSIPKFSYSVVVSPSGAGSISSYTEPSGLSSPYAAGTIMHSAAYPTTGYTFSSWSNCSSPSGNTCVETISSNKTIYANFTTSSTHTLNVTNYYPQGGIVYNVTNGGGYSNTSYPDGTNLTLVAYPYPGYTFTYWSGCDYVDGTACHVSMTSDKNLYVSFNQEQD